MKTKNLILSLFTLLAVNCIAHECQDLTPVAGLPELNTIIQEEIIKRSENWQSLLTPSILTDIEVLKETREKLFTFTSELSYLDRHYLYSAPSLFKKFLDDESVLTRSERAEIVKSLTFYNPAKVGIALRKKAIMHAITAISYVISRYPNYKVIGTQIELDDINERTVLNNLLGATLEAIKEDQAFRESL